jgi:RNA-directed DNA polymerase
MKRYGNLWESLISFENLYRAARNARRGKRNKSPVEAFEFHLEGNLVELRESLRNRTYRPGPFRTFTVTDPKPRLISAAPYRDRVLHHALCNVLEPVFERSFIFDSYACRRGKGSHAALNRYTDFARKNRYVLKCDVRKFFPSIDHQMLKERLSRKIKDPEVLWLAGLIIDHSNPQEPVSGFFPGDDLFTSLDRPRGIPIGNQTSQFFANVYLDPLDHFIKENLRCRCYLRYCDDFVILDHDKGRLQEVLAAVDDFLKSLRLWLHPTKRVVSRVQDGLPLLGFRVWPHRRLLQRANVRRFRRRMRRYQRSFSGGTLSAAELTCRIRAWIGHAIHADSRGLLRALFERIVFTGLAAGKPRAPRRFLEQQCDEHPFGQPQQEPPGQPEPEQRVSCGEHCTQPPRRRR